MLDISRIDHERLRERIQSHDYLQTFCQVEGLDKEYFKYTILGSLQKTPTRFNLCAWVKEKLTKIATTTGYVISIQKDRREYRSRDMKINERKIS
ncbi:MAG: hypothetical protein CVV52_09485 [Spirochaetae bacterium HGW-Spirochaetae-8]|jgi:hypothetical protein|nr:MAG: hypothetical protein CVV52_09485 [Spirochaetae bacterium HGW-Spirochaetae-8]